MILQSRKPNVPPGRRLFARPNSLDSAGKFATKTGSRLTRPRRQSGIIAARATIAFSSEVDPGSREENASNKNLESEHRQLIERVNRLKADQEKRSDHEIIAEMHRRACNRRLLAARGNRAGTVTKRGAQRTTPSPGEIPAGDNDRKASAAAEVMRSSRTSSTGGLLFDASFVPVHVPWKILSPHNTTTMADIRVAAVNTLSMEATLIPLSASQPRQRSR
jgi:hypothetical protein